MGNAVCTDSTPQSLSDILGAPFRRSGSAMDNRVLFDSFQHNVKAWSFTVSWTAAGVAAQSVRLDSSSSTDPSKCYVILHTQRLAKNPTDSPAEAPLAEDPLKSMPLSQSAWAVEAMETFTPRGMADPSSVDLTDLGWRSAAKFTYAVYLFKGRGVPPLAVAAATERAFELERLLVRHPRAAERLFFNNFCTNPPVAVRCIGIRSSVWRCSAAQLKAIARANALFRSIHELKVAAPTPSSTPKPLTAKPPAAIQTPHAQRSNQVQELRASVASLLPPQEVAPVETRPSPKKEAEAEIAPKPLVPRLPTRKVAPVDETDHEETDVKASESTEPPSELDATRRPVMLQDVCAPVQEEEDLVDRAERLKQMSPCATEILPYLFVGGEMPAKDCNLLLSLGVTHVINVASIALQNFFPDLFDYTALPLGDSPDEDIFSLFYHVIGVIERARASGGRAFVHCHQGVSRSCAFVIAYVMWKHGWCYDVAYKHVRQRRTVCSPNVGFYINLLRWESHLAHCDPLLMWSFLPFSQEYPLPVSFKTIKLNTSLPLVLDPRTCHILVSFAPEKGGPLTGKVCFVQGNRCHGSVVEEARKETADVLLYGLYTNELSETVNARGKAVKFEPCALTSEDVAYHKVREECDDAATSAALSEMKQLGGWSVVSVGPVHTERYDDLLMSALPQKLEVYINEKLAAEANSKAENRKRKRDEIEETSRQQSRSSPRDVEDAAEAAADEDTSGDPLLVLQLPDFLPVDIFEYSDFESDAAYIVTIRGSSVANREDRATLWIGSGANVTPDDLQSALREWTSAPPQPDTPPIIEGARRTIARVLSRSGAAAVIEEGEEPDEFICLF